jgi:hypothetical protein
MTVHAAMRGRSLAPKVGCGSATVLGMIVVVVLELLYA